MTCTTGRNIWLVKDTIGRSLHSTTIVSLDTKELFRFIAAALDEVSVSPMNDYLLQEQLLYWHTLVNKILIELPLIMSGFEDLVHYYFLGTAVPTQVNDIVDKLHRGSRRLVGMTETRHMSIDADVAFSRANAKSLKQRVCRD